MSKALSETEIRAVIEPEFSVDFYLHRYPDVKQAGMDPVFHYIRHGWQEGRDPTAAFSTSFYLRDNPDVAAEGVNPFWHFLVSGSQQGRRPLPLPGCYADEQQYRFVRQIVAAEFDAEFYRQANPGFERQIKDPLDHFLLFGWRAGCDPRADFAVADYLAAHGEIRASGVNPFYHYLVLGRLRGSQGWLQENLQPGDVETGSGTEAMRAAFDPVYYLNRYHDIRAAGIDPFAHFCSSGWREGRDPSPDFCTRYYLEMNPDIQAAGVNPLYHYVTAGKAEGRLPCLPGGPAAQALARLESLDQRVRQWQLAADPSVVLLDAESLGVALEPALEPASQLVISLGHDDYRESVGGVQYCILLEQAAVTATGAVYLNLHPLQPLPIVSRETDLRKVLLRVVCNGRTLGVASAADCLAALGMSKAAVQRVDLVVHALFGHSPAFVEALASRHIPGESIYWVHDYLSVCPGYNLLRNGIRFCGAPAQDSMACSICIYAGERQHQHREFSQLFAAVSFTVMAPSQFAADLWLQKAGLPHRNIVVQPHARLVRDLSQTVVESASVAQAAEAPLRIAYLGHPEFHKGWHYFVDLVRHYQGDPGYEFHHLGQHPSTDVNVLHTPVVVSAGNRSAMVDALRSLRIDVALVWSVWPETYCFTAHEAVAAGALVVTNPDSGNVARMVEEGNAGLVFESFDRLRDAFDSGAIARRVRQWRSESVGQPQLQLAYGGISAAWLQGGGVTS